MATTVALLRVLMCGVFVTAAVTKLRDHTRFTRTLLDFGTPAVVAPTLALLFPVSEFAVGVALLIDSMAGVAAAVGLALLLLFSVAVAINLVQGNRPDCNCFGQLQSAPIGVSTLVRNVCFAVPLALMSWLTLTNPHAFDVSWRAIAPQAESVATLLSLLAVVGVGLTLWLVVGMMRLQGRLLLRLEALEAAASTARGGARDASDKPVPAAAALAGLGVGSVAPTFRLADLHGQHRTLADLTAGGVHTMLLFIDANCGPCAALMPDVAKWQSEYAGRLAIVPITRGSLKVNREKLAKAGVRGCLVQQDREVASAYRCEGTPGSVIVTPQGLIASAVAMGADAIKAQVAEWVRSDGRARLGDPVPAISLPDLDGRSANLSDSLGKRTAVLFWDPACGFCAKILSQLQEWERRASADSPEVLVVSTGSVDQNRAQQLRSRTVLDQNFSVGRAFGAPGSPSAVLIDRAGRIASPIAAGGPAVIELLSTNLSAIPSSER